MESSTFKMLNEVVKHVTIPKEWEYMKIKSIYKGKGKKKEMNNQRDIIITNILSKSTERIIHTRNKKNLRKGTSEHQNWSMEKRCIYDNKNHKKYMYILLANEIKCFDKLWLNDAYNELNKI